MKKPALFYLLLLLILLYLLPIWAFEFLPFVDLPQHLAIAHIAHNYQNPQTLDFSQFFTLQWFPQVYILPYLFLHLVNFFLPLEVAGKLLLSLIIILLPISIYALIKTLGGNPWFSLLSFFFIYNYNLLWGFIGYCLGIPLFFFALCLLLRLTEQKDSSLKMKLGLTLILFLALLTHPYIYMLATICFLTILFFNKLARKEIAKNLLLALPAFVFLLFCLEPTWAKKGKVVLENLSSSWPTLALIKERVLNLPRYLLSGLAADQIIFWFISIIFFSLFLCGRFTSGCARKSVGDKKGRHIYLLTLLIAGLYLVLPQDICGLVSIVGPRLAIFIPLLLIGPLSKVHLRRGYSILIVPTLVALAFHFSSLLAGFHKFELQAKPVRMLLSQTERNKRLVELYTYPNDSAFFFHSFVHFGCYYTIWKDGLCGFIFPQKDTWYIIKQKEGADLPSIKVFSAWKSVFPVGWENFDYFLVCGQVSAEQEGWLKPVASLHLIGQEGIWRLYEKRDLSCQP